MPKENIVAAEKNEEGKAQNKEREGEEGRVLVLVADSQARKLCAHLLLLASCREKRWKQRGA